MFYLAFQTYQKLVQAPNGLRDRLLELIRFEAEQAENHQPAQIRAKMNSLVDPDLIAALEQIRRYSDENLGPSRSSLLSKIAAIADAAIAKEKK